MNRIKKQKFAFWTLVVIAFVSMLIPIVLFIIISQSRSHWVYICGFKCLFFSCVWSILAQLPLIFLVIKDWQIRKFSSDKETLNAIIIGIWGVIGALCYYHKYKRKKWLPDEKS